ncbi:hypothetical protein [Streptomyces melanogenes]|uniref:hypothetical protein n=1 Tax=Streptomyces melanogenes TaxID=67326 RepID=UPI003795D9E0
MTGMLSKGRASGRQVPRKKRGKAFALAAAALTMGAGASVGAPGAQAAALVPHDAAGSAAAVTCYGGAWRYDKPAGLGYAPAGDGYYVATNRCADIQVKPDNNTEMAVCVLNSGCTSFATMPAGEWTIMKRKVPDGSYFWFKFTNTSAHKTGLVAA